LTNGSCTCRFFIADSDKCDAKNIINCGGSPTANLEKQYGLLGVITSERESQKFPGPRGGSSPGPPSSPGGGPGSSGQPLCSYPILQNTLYFHEGVTKAKVFCSLSPRKGTHRLIGSVFIVSESVHHFFVFFKIMISFLTRTRLPETSSDSSASPKSIGSNFVTFKHSRIGTQLSNPNAPHNSS